MNFFRKNVKHIKVVKYDPPIQHVHIITDSLNIMNKTTNPDTYFSRYRTASNESILISDYDEIIYNGMTPIEIHNMLNDDYEKDELHIEFIDRLFRENKEDLLTYQLYEVGLHMSEEVREYFVNKLNGKKYHFCKVKFNENSNRLYTYVTKDKDINIGDTVTIPTGNGFVPESKVLQVADVFEASLDSLEFPLVNLRCVERKLKSIECPHCGAALRVDSIKKVGKCPHCDSEFYFI